MRVISLKKLRTFYQVHPDSKETLTAWYAVISHSEFADHADLRRAFPQADFVKPFHVFNIGRAYRLIVAIHFNRQKVFVRHVLTHAEYDRGKWKVK
jgi:mRNA interferase HigB